MFFYEHIPWQSAIMWLVVLGALIGLNEISRLNKWIALIMFTLVPIVLTLFVWPTTAGAGSSTGTWFHWVKVYSALAGCLGFWVIRYVKGASNNKYWLMFPPLILALNITEAVIRDFQVYSLHGVVDGVFMNGGIWNIMNGVAGILNIITISGWMGIQVSKNKQKDMVWADQMWFWIIAYDLWNFAYVYNCVSDHSFYAGLALLLSCTIPAFFIKKGAWLQHRAHTLAFWMMFTMSFPAFVSDSQFAVQSSHSSTALFVASALSLGANILVFIFHFYRIKVTKRNILTQEIYVGLDKFEEVKKAN
ncbi:DUF5692 family protein [Vagococcus intermedius]|uniref:DUF5692 family protein n=2 Tax=Vagococcus intermedius TaxID=2991418 RepID=A0AAF0CWN4_9ENTE|nr:DUF5692 family protein [Vagococcus intermedius]WEG74254.1 DUF5692 family protein [Vagococcus intermedius]